MWKVTLSGILCAISLCSGTEQDFLVQTFKQRTTGVTSAVLAEQAVTLPGGQGKLVFKNGKILNLDNWEIVGSPKITKRKGFSEMTFKLKFPKLSVSFQDVFVDISGISGNSAPWTFNGVNNLINVHAVMSMNPLQPRWIKVESVSVSTLTAMVPRPPPGRDWGAVQTSFLTSAGQRVHADVKRKLELLVTNAITLG